MRRGIRLGDVKISNWRGCRCWTRLNVFNASPVHPWNWFSRREVRRSRIWWIHEVGLHLHRLTRHDSLIVFIWLMILLLMMWLLLMRRRWVSFFDVRIRSNRCEFPVEHIPSIGTLNNQSCTLGSHTSTILSLEKFDFLFLQVLRELIAAVEMISTLLRQLTVGAIARYWGRICLEKQILIVEMLMMCRGQGNWTTVHRQLIVMIELWWGVCGLKVSWLIWTTLETIITLIIQRIWWAGKVAWILTIDSLWKTARVKEKTEF